ncbi:MAG: NADH-quinone oxidoreductase subunit C [Acidimicrobiia bacterium]|nr:NADH-quinone oxidoreductase subunit C [Acidimicrobiia bacterium]
MTESPSEAPAVEAAAVAERFAALADATSSSAEHGTAKIMVPRQRWVEVHQALKEHLPFFSYLSAIDWSAEVSVGEPPAEDAVTGRFEVVTRLSDVDEGKALIVSTDLPHDDATIASLVGVYGGANWHEREAYEMFGIDFAGHPNLIKLYLPDGFEGNPLRKSFRLLSREVKAWPGTVDVEGMPGSADDGPSTENVEAGDA